ncbi:PREDICTED: pentatricopeptide repeat-containing protein At3g60980, mitochondrial-like [Camelina sativa]|uniref:Pentatricopeptide repeat-containing protein At3g60980, mitochondrial-like n=1 Tax=Camelina sativa TaxID=90675 RepID=A0ABM0SLN5_CAMSA|nr:PREDICTED: pentatricopeptide repeat-containing protein At3g60980, mitochondrial-like [Camelina sativa]
MFLCRRLVLSSFRSFSSVVKKDPSLDYRPLALQARVDFLIRLGDLDTAAKHARLAGQYSSYYIIGLNETCQAIIGAMCEAKRYEDALDLFHYFYRDSKIAPCHGYFNHIIKLHLDQGRLDDALNLYDSSLANHVTQSLISKGLVDAGRQDEVMDLLDQPRSFSNLAWDENVYKPPQLEGLLRQGDFEKADEVLGHLLGSSHVHGDGYDRFAIFSHTYMKYWFEQGKEDKAMHCYSRLQLRKLTKATVVNALLALLLKYGKKTEAWSLFDQVLHSKEMHNLNHYTLNIMVNECFKIGRFDRAIQIFHKVKALKLKFPHACYRNIITRLNKQGILFEAEHLFQEICSDELVSPDVSTYTSMIDAYLKAGRTEDALRLSNKMVDAFLGQLARLACL